MSAASRLTDAELAAAKQEFAEAKASLACEGIYLTAEEEALFARFEEQRLSHDECRRQLIEFCRAKRRQKALSSTLMPDPYVKGRLSAR
jgi:RNase adaptor protein for sRNA GlmZ degradation